MKRLVISDTHIGSRFNKENNLYDFFKSEEYDQLILNGDIIEFLKIPIFTKRYEFEEDGRKFRIEHGDRYEKGIVHHRSAMKIISVFQDLLERYFNLDVSTWFNNLRINKRKIKRLWDIIDLNNDVDVLIVGHTHIPEAVIWIDENEKIKTYVNSGDWVSHSTYVEINDGVVRLRNFLKKQK